MSVDLATLYEDTHQRLAGLVAGLAPAELAMPVPACPGWSVKDVVGHLAGVAEDAIDGRLSGPPDDVVTAAEVARFRDRSLTEVLERWAQVAAPFGELITAFKIWPGLIDVVTHEHDIRGALGRPGARDSDGVGAASGALLKFDVPVPLIVRVEGREVRNGPEDGPALVLETTRWEALRWRMGRRSREQLAQMRWTGDPLPVLDHLAIFGPAEQNIIE